MRFDSDNLQALFYSPEQRDLLRLESTVIKQGIVRINSHGARVVLRHYTCNL